MTTNIILCSTREAQLWIEANGCSWADFVEQFGLLPNYSSSDVNEWVAR